MKIDMHIHTRGSFDCLSDPDAVIEAALEKGIDRVCITDHNRIDVALRQRARHPDRVIAGEEVRTGEGVDVIGLFLHTLIPKGTPARRACELIREQGGIVYVPHPFADGKGGGGRVLASIADLVDVVEGFNARIHKPALNGRAVEWARDRALPLGAGSDAHTLGEIGSAYAEVDEFDDDPAAFLAALRGGSIHGSESSRLVHVASTWAKVRKHLPGA